MLHRFPSSAASSLFLACVFAGLGGPSHVHAAQDPAAGAPVSQAFPEYKLTVTLPALEGLTPAALGDAQIIGAWKASLGGAALDISLRALPLDEFHFDEPEDVNELLLNFLQSKRGGQPDFKFDDTRLVAGKFGFASYAALAHGALRDGTKVSGDVFVLGGLLERHGYSLRVDARPSLGEASTKVVWDLLAKSIAYDGVVRDFKWTEEEVLARWKKDAPEKSQKKFEKPIRTAHYIILTDSSGGKLFGEKMEECYVAIRKMYPFKDVAGQKLMPVFLFQTPDGYYEFFAKKHGVSIEAAKRSKGHASSDYYATWYEAPNDPVHLHEATHQIFRNRLRLSGGGSWFQEGVAEYIETRPGDRSNAIRLIKKQEHMPLAKFVTIPSLIYSTDEGIKGGDEAGDLYKQAAALIEFLRESKWSKDKFQTFLHTVGMTPPNDLAAITNAVREVYGCDLAELEKQWVEYCKKR